MNHRHGLDTLGIFGNSVVCSVHPESARGEIVTPYSLLPSKQQTASEIISTWKGRQSENKTNTERTAFYSHKNFTNTAEGRETPQEPIWALIIFWRRSWQFWLDKSWHEAAANPSRGMGRLSLSLSSSFLHFFLAIARS